MFASIWAWTNYTWWATAYDTDDWYVRLAVLGQMLGVVVLTLGIPPLFHGFEVGWQLHNEVMVAGYVVMRVSMVALWLRAGHDDPEHARLTRGYAVVISLVQVGWLAMIPFRPPIQWWLPLYVVLFVAELVGPWLVEQREGRQTRWHPHHVAERYGNLVLISLGEGIVGTVLAAEALVASQGWSLGAILLAVGGVAVTMGLWWMYFTVPFGWLLERKPLGAFVLGYGHIPLLMAIAAVGGGLHVAAYAFEGEAHLGPVGVVTASALPVALVWLSTFALFHYFVPGRDLVHLLDAVGTVVTLVLAVVLAGAGAAVELCLLLVVLAPWVTVVGFEIAGHRSVERNLARIDGGR